MYLLTSCSKRRW